MSLRGEAAVSDDVDAAVEAGQRPARHARLEHRECDPDRRQLPPGDNTPLSICQFRQDLIWMRCDFGSDADLNSHVIGVRGRWR